MKPKYINLFTDFGFKKIFGEEASKAILIDFLNALLPAETHIKDLTFKNTEQKGNIHSDRNALYDIFCVNNIGEKFKVGLKFHFDPFDLVYHRKKHPADMMFKYFFWQKQLMPIYFIDFLGFVTNEYNSPAEAKEVIHEIKLRKPDGRVFYDKLTYIYLEMPNFDKVEPELNTRLDKWLYFIKHLEDFQSIPAIFKNEVVFLKAFEKAEVANLNHS
jgi:hypothetical protein